MIVLESGLVKLPLRMIQGKGTSAESHCASSIYGANCMNSFQDESISDVHVLHLNTFREFMNDYSESSSVIKAAHPATSLHIREKATCACDNAVKITNSSENATEFLSLMRECP